MDFAANDKAGTMESGAMVHAACRSIYDETRAIYQSRSADLGERALGYRILYGPPVPEPEYLFVGYQPGGKADAVLEQQHRSWPEECEYALDRQALRAVGWTRPTYALNMQKIWGVCVLRRSTGLNAVFFRSPSMEQWSRVQAELRTELEKFSLTRLKRIIEVIRPKRIAVIGLGTFDWLTRRAGLKGRDDALVSPSGRRALVKGGELYGCPTFGVVHLSGARVSGVELDAMKAYFAQAAPI